MWDLKCRPASFSCALIANDVVTLTESRCRVSCAYQAYGVVIAWCASRFFNSEYLILIKHCEDEDRKMTEIAQMKSQESWI